MRLAKGTYARVAKLTGVSASLVAKVAAGKRRNVRIEIELERERVSQQRAMMKLQRLRNQDKHTN